MRLRGNSSCGEVDLHILLMENDKFFSFITGKNVYDRDLNLNRDA